MDRMCINIDNLPEVLLIEILCRIPCNKLIFQCKCVSKRWSDLISSTYFVGRYLRIQRDLQKPRHLTTLISRSCSDNSSYSLISSTSDHPVFQSANFSLGFLPPSDQPQAQASCDSCYLYWNHYFKEGCQVLPPVIVATYKDLVLCCTTPFHHRDYYLCNPYTKQWTRLPPARHVSHDRVPVALVCDPYYNYCQNGNEEEIFINPEYMWKVVRLVPNTSDADFHLEIFSSETRHWRDFDVSCSRPVPFKKSMIGSWSFIVYNGMLYYWCCGSSESMLEIDLSSCSGDHNNVAKCRFMIIELPVLRPTGVGCNPYLVVSQGRLLLFRHLRFQDIEDIVEAWDLKQVVNRKEDINSGELQGKFKLVDRISLLNFQGPDDELITRTVLPVPYSSSSWLSFDLEANFHQNNNELEDVVYFQARERPYHPRWILITCNFIGGRLEAAAQTRFLPDNYNPPVTYPFVLLWWPTPIHSL